MPLHVLVCGGEGFKNRVRDIAAHGIFPALGADQSLHHAGTQFRNITGGHEKDGVYFGCEIRIDVAHDTLVFVVISGTHPAQDISCALLLGVVDEIAIVEVGEGETLTGGDRGFQEFEALLLSCQPELLCPFPQLCHVLLACVHVVDADDRNLLRRVLAVCSSAGSSMSLHY